MALQPETKDATCPCPRPVPVDASPGGTDDLGVRAPADRIPPVRGRRSDRPDRAVRGAVPHPERDLSHLRPNDGVGLPHSGLDGQRPTGPPCTFCPTSARFRSTRASSRTGAGFSPRASPPASTAPCSSPPSCAATPSRRASKLYMAYGGAKGRAALRGTAREHRPADCRASGGKRGLIGASAAGSPPR